MPTPANPRLKGQRDEWMLFTNQYQPILIRLQRLSQPQKTESIHGNIALFDVALRGLESGDRQCFRSLRGDIPE
jgi:hypothetical protein